MISPAKKEQGTNKNIPQIATITHFTTKNGRTKRRKNRGKKRKKKSKKRSGEFCHF
jgi:hypothetical protein